MTITFICCFNDRQQLESMLLPSLDKLVSKDEATGYKFNRILIDNTGGRYRCASEAFNTEIELHSEELGEILVFLHQDIAFDDDRFFRHMIDFFSQHPNSVLGAAGMPEAGCTVSNLKYIKTKQYITPVQTEGVAEVCSVDECCFAIPRELFQKLHFDEKTCFHWHLYAADFCYDAKRRFGTGVYVLPDSIYHKQEEGGLGCDQYFLRTMWRMIRKYRKDFDSIYCSCYIVKTSFLPSVIHLAKSYVRNIIK